MNTPPNPFKYIPIVKTLLQAFAFVTACCTVIWVAVIKKTFEWNSRSIAVLALCLLGFIAILMVNSLSKKDRAKTLLWLVIFLGSCITIIVLAIQDIVHRKIESALMMPPSNHQSSGNVASNQNSTTNSIVQNSPQSAITHAEIVQNVTSSYRTGSANGALTLPIASLGTNSENRIWVVIPGGTPTTFITEYRLADEGDPLSFYLGAPWTKVKDAPPRVPGRPPAHSFTRDDTIKFLLPGEALAYGTLYALGDSNTYNVVFRNANTPFDLSKTNSILDCVRAFQTPKK